MASDPDFSSVSLLLSGDGAQGSTVITDSSGNPKTPLTLFGPGGIAIDTSTAKFGSGSIIVVGNKYIMYDASPDFDFGSGDFTIEFEYRNGDAYAVPRYPVMYSKSSYSAATDLAFYVSIDPNDHVAGWVAIGSSGVSAVGPSATVGFGAWHHIAMVRHGGVLQLFLDGVGGPQVSAPGNIVTPPDRILHIGIDPITNNGGGQFNIDELRITKGVARYTADFTPPTEAFGTAPPAAPPPPPPPPPPSPQVAGTVRDTSGAPAIRTVRAHRRDTGAVLGETTSAADGTFSIPTEYAGEIQLLCLDDAASPLLNDLVARVFAQTTA